MDPISSFEEEMLKRIEDAVEKANIAVFEELLPQYTKDIEDTFKGAAMEWYGSYTPEYYNRKHSLYKLVDTKTNPKTGEFTVRISDDQMTKDRKGGSLFEKVVVQGWHGGASGWSKPDVVSVDSNGHAYDDTIGKTYGAGTIRYRAPYPHYNRWGRPAVRTISAMELFDQKSPELIEEYTEIRNQMFIKYFVEYMY